MNITQEIERQTSLVHWINEHLTVEIPVDDHSFLSIGCFDIAIEHHAAIVSLSQSELYGSALSLVRAEYESVVRGLWLKYCATDQDAEKFRGGSVKPKFHELVSSVESAVGVKDGYLSRLHSTSWGLLNDLTHTGIGQVRSRHSSNSIGAAYDLEFVCSALSVAGTVSLISAVELASYNGDTSLVQLVLAKSRDYSGTEP